MCWVERGARTNLTGINYSIIQLNGLREKEREREKKKINRKTHIYIERERVKERENV